MADVAYEMLKKDGRTYTWDLRSLQCSYPNKNDWGQRSIRNRRTLSSERERHHGLFRICFSGWSKQSQTACRWRFGRRFFHCRYHSGWGKKTAPDGKVQVINLMLLHATGVLVAEGLAPVQHPHYLPLLYPAGVLWCVYVYVQRADQPLGTFVFVFLFCFQVGGTLLQSSRFLHALWFTPSADKVYHQICTPWTKN